MKKPQPQKLMGICVLTLAGGMVLLNYPFLEIFSGPARFCGFPPLLLFLFSGWGVLILLSALWSSLLEDDENKGKTDHRRRDEQP